MLIHIHTAGGFAALAHADGSVSRCCISARAVCCCASGGTVAAAPHQQLSASHSDAHTTAATASMSGKFQASRFRVRLESDDGDQRVTVVIGIEGLKVMNEQGTMTMRSLDLKHISRCAQLVRWRGWRWGWRAAGEERWDAVGAVGPSPSSQHDLLCAPPTTTHAQVVHHWQRQPDDLHPDPRRPRGAPAAAERRPLHHPKPAGHAHLQLHAVSDC